MLNCPSPRIQVFPLLESQPGRTGLRFPEDAFRMTDRMEFINVDTNTVDKRLTEQFTGALREAGFVFSCTVYKALFPFYIKTTDKTSGYLRFDVIRNGPPALIGIAFSLVFAIIVMNMRKLGLRKHWADLAIIMFTGLYYSVS
ncbi:MAG: DUF4857 domain-containing protein [Deltaproteobacteria bacterium]|nr:DUF4857 domain-containing protein [Deltaproteobacteria bacterium]